MLLRVETLEATETTPQSLLTVTAHRDELAEMRRLLGFKELEEDAIG